MMKHIQIDQFEAFAYQIAKQGKSCCGDGYYVQVTHDYVVCVIADGLGREWRARQCSSSAVISIVNEHHTQDVQMMIKYCNKALKKKEGQ